MDNIYKAIGKGFIVGLVFVPAVMISSAVSVGVIIGAGRYLERKNDSQ